jgi:hypothetical protein
VSAYPAIMMSVMGLFSPMIRELQETNYQFQAPFVMDSSDAQKHFGLAPTPWADVIGATLDSFRDQVPA